MSVVAEVDAIFGTVNVGMSKPMIEEFFSNWQ